LLWFHRMNSKFKSSSCQQSPKDPIPIQNVASDTRKAQSIWARSYVGK
jgi:hypothetical protein